MHTNTDIVDKSRMTTYISSEKKVEKEKDTKGKRNHGQTNG